MQKSLSKFLSLNCQLVIVSFGNKKGANRWLNQNKLNEKEHEFDFITDENKTLYKLFGLKRSFQKVWNTQTLIYYAEQVSLNRELPKAYEDVEDDPHQMGGNFILKNDNDNNFEVIYAYRSKSPPDRPSAQALIDFLNGL